MNTKAPMSLRGLRTFCAAARYQSFRAASDALFITPSAVSHQIKSLEQELGEQLFDRNSRSLTLTDLGQSLYAQISPLIEQLDAIVATYKTGASSSTIRISVQPFFASELFVPALSEFTAAHPDIDLQVGTSDETLEKHPSDADLSIRLFKSPPASLPSDLILPLRLVPAGAPAFAKTLKVVKKKIVSDFPLIVHETRPRAWERWAAETGIELPEEPRIIRLDSMIAAARAAEKGIGAAMMPVPIGDRWFESGSLVRLFDTELVADVGYYLVCREDLSGDRNVQAVRKWILHKFVDSR